MRMSRCSAVVFAVLTAGCSMFVGEEESELAVSPEVAQEYMLIRPPDGAAAVHIVEFVDYLPDDDDSFPGQANGLDETERERSERLFRELQTQPTALARARLLADEFVDEDAPISEWQHVRLFRSRDYCEETRLQLQEVTREQSRKIAYQPGMLLNDLQFLWLASSFASSQCVPLDQVREHRTS